MRSGLALLYALLAFALVGGNARADEVRLSMSASSNRVQTGEPFAVEIRAEMSGSSDDDTEIDLPEFEQFEVLGRRVSRPFSFSFGFGGGGQGARVQSQLIHSYTLRAQRPGRFVIQPAVITIGSRKYASRPLTIEVVGSASPGVPNGAAPAGDTATGAQGPNTTTENPLDGARFDPEMFVRTAVDRHRAYVGEQVTVTIYLYVRGGLRETPTVSREPTNEGFWTQDLLPLQRALSATRQDVNGRVYSAYVLRRYAAFPMRAGKLVIGPAAVETSGGGSLFDLFAGPSKPIRRSGVPVTIEVSELPERADSRLPVHVGQLSLEATLDPPNVKAGEAATLKLVASGNGNLRSLKIEAPPISGVEVLPPEIDDKVTTDLDVVGGTRIFRWLLLAREPGLHAVPPVAVNSLDPRTGTYSKVQSGELKLEITGATAVPSLGPVQGSGSGAEPANGQAGTTKEAAPTYGAVRLQSALLREHTPLHQAPWYGWALLAAPLCLLLGLVGRWTMRAVAARTPSGQSKEQAFKLATGQLARARELAREGETQGVFGALSQAVKSGLEARLGAPIGGLTRRALRTHLEQRGMDTHLATAVVNELDELDQARFAPEARNAAELEQRIAQCASTLDNLERFHPKGTP